MILISLQSGSNGNCLFVKSGQTKLLFDGGIDSSVVRSRLNPFDFSAEGAAGIFITHDHYDHIGHVGNLSRAFSLPIYVTRNTLYSAKKKCRLGRLPKVNFFKMGQTVEVGELKVETIRTPHDGVESAAFIVEGDDLRLGIFTDIGHSFPDLVDHLSTLDALFIESNYDPQMLEHGPYPPYLKRRIKGAGGHISNVEAATAIAKAYEQGKKRLQWVCLGHISEANNDPELAKLTHRRFISEEIGIYTAGRHSASELMKIVSREV